MAVSRDWTPTITITDTNGLDITFEGGEVTWTESRTLPDGREAIAVGYRPAGVDFPPADIETYLRAAADSVAGPGLLEVEP